MGPKKEKKKNASQPIDVDPGPPGPGDPEGMAQRQKDGVYCAICWSDYADPMILPACGHCFCRQCLIDGRYWDPNGLIHLAGVECQIRHTKSYYAPVKNFALIEFMAYETIRKTAMNEREQWLQEQ